MEKTGKYIIPYYFAKNTGENKAAKTRVVLNLTKLKLTNEVITGFTRNYC